MTLQFGQTAYVIFSKPCFTKSLYSTSGKNISFEQFIVIINWPCSGRMARGLSAGGGDEFPFSPVRLHITRINNSDGRPRSHQNDAWHAAVGTRETTNGNSGTVNINCTKIFSKKPNSRNKKIVLILFGLKMGLYWLIISVPEAEVLPSWPEAWLTGRQHRAAPAEPSHHLRPVQ